MRELGREDIEFTLERLQGLIRVEEHFQALLFLDQVDFLRQPVAVPEADRDSRFNVQRACLESANGFQRFLRTAAPGPRPSRPGRWSPG